MSQFALTDDELAMVVGAAVAEPEILKRIKEYITHGHRSAKV